MVAGRYDNWHKITGIVTPILIKYLLRHDELVSEFEYLSNSIIWNEFHTHLIMAGKVAKFELKY